MKKSNINNSAKKRSLIALISIFEFINLTYLLFVKYRSQGLSMNDISFEFIGNVLNFIITGLIIFSLLILLFKVKRVDLLRFQILINISLLSFLPLLIADFFTVLDLHQVMTYMFGYASVKIFRAIFFIGFQILKFVILVNVLLLVFNRFRNPVFKTVIYSLLIILLTLFFAFISGLTFKDDRNDYVKTYKKIDAVVVLGAAVWSDNKASPILLGRLRKAVQLYRTRITDRIVLTGGKAPGEMSEARVAQRELLLMGVPVDVISLEEKSSNTLEQILFIKSELIENKNFRNVLVISDHFHLKRVSEISKFNNLKLDFISSDYKLDLITAIWLRIRDAVSLTLYWLFGL